MRQERWALTFFGLLLGIFGYALLESRGFPQAGRYLPLGSAVAGVVLSILLLAVNIRRYSRLWRGQAVVANRASIEGGPRDDIPASAVAFYALCIVMYGGLIALVGAIFASFLFVFLLLRFDAKASNLRSGLAALALVGVLLVLVQTVGLELPAGVLEISGFL